MALREHAARSVPVMWLAACGFAFGGGAHAAGAQLRADSLARRDVAPGLTHLRLVRLAGPWVINVVRLDLRRRELALVHVRARDSLRGRERLSAMAARRTAAGDTVLAAINADFFSLATGEIENNQVLDVEWWKGVKVPGAPTGTFPAARAQFGLDTAQRPLLDRFRFDGEVMLPGGTSLALTALNALPHGGPEATVLFTPRAAAEEGTLSRNAEVRHPRSVIGFTRDSTTLLLVTVDGRQAASAGMTLVELADLMRELGAWHALNFDGGGSTTMLVRDRIANAPSDSAGERAVGNALLVVRRRSGAPAGGSAAPQRPAIDSAQLLTDLAVLAADSMEGRRIGTPGNARARAYLLRRLGALRIAPLGDSLPTPFSAPGRGGTTTSGVNLLAVIPGTRYPNRYVVLSAHYDHVGVRNGEVFNGADDNASGTAGVLALARWLTANRPANSVIVALFDGEEAGSLGAKAFLATPGVPLDSIIANVNLDMVSRNEQGELWAAGARPWPVMRSLLDDLTRVAPVTLRLGHDGEPGRDNWTHQSDQGPFHDRGIPFVYFGVEDHADYHRATDEVERIQPGFYYRAVITVAELVRRLDASLDAVAAVRATAKR